MTESTEFVDVEVELNKVDVEWLDQEAARVGSTRNDLICLAVDRYLDQIGELFKDRAKKRQEKEEASRTEHRAEDSPTAD
ncbi:MAG: hypothetical protein K2Y37_19095 [Pirellulales bacterium]|nr:hypothetical protein [Pirellulales bacterium]